MEAQTQLTGCTSLHAQPCCTRHTRTHPCSTRIHVPQQRIPAPSPPQQNCRFEPVYPSMRQNHAPRGWECIHHSQPMRATLSSSNFQCFDRGSIPAPTIPSPCATPSTQLIIGAAARGARWPRRRCTQRAMPASRSAVRRIVHTRQAACLGQSQVSKACYSAVGG